MKQIGIKENQINFYVIITKFLNIKHRINSFHRSTYGPTTIWQWNQHLFIWLFLTVQNYGLMIELIPNHYINWKSEASLRSLIFTSRNYSLKLTGRSWAFPQEPGNLVTLGGLARNIHNNKERLFLFVRDSENFEIKNKMILETKLSCLIFSLPNH